MEKIKFKVVVEAWELNTKEDIDDILKSVDDLYPDEEIGFRFKQNGKVYHAVLGKGNYQDFACAYRLTIEKDTDLFNNKDELRVFLEHLLKFE
jgi:hypothetical protein